MLITDQVVFAVVFADRLRAYLPHHIGNEAVARAKAFDEAALVAEHFRKAAQECVERAPKVAA